MSHPPTDLEIAQLASQDASAASGHTIDCDCTSCCLVRTEAFRARVAARRDERGREQRKLKDRLLEVMTPDRPMTTLEISDAYAFEFGGAPLGDDVVGAALADLSHDHDEGREVKIGADCKTWTRPIAVGMGATVMGYTDRRAATVIAVSPSGHKVTVRLDKATRTDTNGMSEDQTYDYAPDPEGEVKVFYRDRNYRIAGEKHGYGNRAKGGRLMLGCRRSYHDYSF